MTNTPFELSSIDGTNGFVINGIDLGDQSGISVSAAGDVNGDGIDDIIIGARLADPNGSNSGESYVVFGSAAGFGATIELSALDGSNGFVINGIDTGDTSGGSVSAAGDVNGDGIDDIIIGAFTAAPNGSESGESYVVFGQASGFGASLELSALDGSNGFVVNGIDADDRSGRSVSAAGDVNGDGIDDIIIRASGGDTNGSSSGESYVVFGQASGFGAALELSALDGSNGFVINGIDAGDFSGVSVSSAGDVNGDGIDDIIVGAAFADPNGTSSGESYVVFGSDTGFGAALELSALDGSNGFVINGIDTNDGSGFSVSDAGDVNGDGIDDIIIGAFGAAPNGSDSGESYVVFGQASGFGASLELSALDGSNGFVINGIDAGDTNLGISVSAAGDVNGDGIDDIIIGAFAADPNGSDSGESYVVFGQASGFGAALDLSALNGTNGFVVNGIDAGDFSGRSVSAAGDVNGDGVDDIIIGAERAAPNGTNSGESYVVFGVQADLDIVGTAGNDTLTGRSADDTLSGLGGDDVLNGGEGNDTAIFTGAQADYTITGNLDGTIIVLDNTGTDGTDTLINVEFAQFSDGTFNLSTVPVGVFELSSLDGSNGFVINGIDASDRSGVSVSAAGDVNGDGIDDIIIGAPGGDPNGGISGESYVVFGSAAGFGASLELSALDGSNGFVINGIGFGDQSGISVSAAGDVNGDGIDDIIIGAPGGDPNGNRTAGESYVVFGSDSGFGASLELSALDGTNGFVINGIDASDTDVRISVSAAGDVNGDGIDDIIIGADRADPNGSDSGESYVVFGSDSGFGASLELSALDGSNGFVINGIDADDNSGRSVSAAGDVNGDGIDDIIIGANFADPNGNTLAGESYVVFGSVAGFGAALELSALNGTNGFIINGIDLGDQSGISVSAAGDINGDGVDDIIIGASSAAPNGSSTVGESYVVFGSAAGFGANLELSALDGSNGFVINGIGSGDNSGISVSSAGDINDDGIDDIIIGALGGDPNGSNTAGESYVVFGQASGFGAALDLSALDGTNGFVINGIDDFDQSGRSVSAAGDVNGDGVDDIIIGAELADPNGSSSGESYVVFGIQVDLDIVGTAGNDTLTGRSGDDTLSGLDGDDTLFGEAGNDTLFGNEGNDTLLGGGGTDVIDGGDGIDTNSFADIGLGVTADIAAGTASYGMVNETFTNIENLIGTLFDDTLTGDSGNNVLTGLAGNDILNAGAGDDTLDGGDGVDTADGSARTEDWVVNLGSGVALITGVESNSLISIENFIGGSGDDRIFGSAEDNVLTGNDGDDLLAGLDGIDTLNGGLGIDSLSGGNGNDILNGGDGDDRLFGNNDDDVINGGDGDDFTNGGNGDDDIFGGLGDDNVLVGGNGSDEIHGNEGNDGINGSAGDDFLYGGDGEDRLFGGSGEDRLEGGNDDDILGGLGDNDLIIGGAGDDGINGGGGDDELFGDAGEDRLFGGTGDDVLNGGTGDDLLVGQAGVDTFVFSNNWGNDQISGYGTVASGAPRVDETIDFSSLLDSGGNAVDFADLTFTQMGNSTIITVDGHDGNSIEVLFRAVTEFTADDFAFG